MADEGAVAALSSSLSRPVDDRGAATDRSPALVTHLPNANSRMSLPRV
jgi:hypothetical protein